MTRTLRFAVLCACFLAASVRAQSAVEIKPTVDSNGLTGPIAIRLQIKNNSVSTYVDVTRATVQLPAGMLSAGRKPPVDQMLTVDLDPQQSAEVALTVPGIEWYKAFKPVFYQWRQNIAVITLHVVTHPPETAAAPADGMVPSQPADGGGSQEQDFTVTTDITPAPSLILIMAGGIVGVLLLLAFYAAVRPLRLRRETLRKQFIIGAIAVVIFSVVSKVTQQNVIPLPIAIEVRDFYGGIVLGLFSDVIVAEFLRLIDKRKG